MLAESRNPGGELIRTLFYRLTDIQTASRADLVDFFGKMDSRPLVTYAGDQAVFAAIEPGLVGGLPTESIEWKRFNPPG